MFAKGYIPKQSEEDFINKKVKNTVPWTYAISDLNGEKIAGIFYKKQLQNTNQKNVRTAKLIKKNIDKLCVKWKGYDNSFNSWKDKKDIL